MFQNQKISIFTIIFLILLISCNKEDTPEETLPDPEAFFEYTLLEDGLVSFNNLSKNASNYSWNFGDSAISTLFKPTHQYIRNGDFQVILEAIRGDLMNSYSSTIEVSNVINDSWAKTADFPGEKRYLPLSFEVNNNYYVGFGTSINPLNLKDLWEYNPQNNAWTQKNDGPIHISGGVSFVIGNFAYVGLGEFGNDFLKYDPSSDSWEYLNDFPGNGGKSNITGATAFAIGDYGYILNGRETFTWDKEFWKYDPENDQWERLEDFPGEARHQSTHFILNGKAYVSCGATATGFGNQVFYNDLWVYDPVLDNWTEKDDFPGAGRIGAIGFSLNGKGYIGLGWESVDDWYTGDADFFSDLYEYDPENNTWKERTSFTDITRIYSFIFEFDDRIWVGTGKGLNGVIKNDIWEYKHK